MKKSASIAAVGILICCSIGLYLFGQGGVNLKDTRLLAQPAISKAHIAFVYAGDLWVSNVNGAEVRRLTSDEGVESNPAFSPDGKLIAFSAQYDGNTDVYVVPIEGGSPKRLTWHPGADIVQGFTPDGASVLFSSPRAVFTDRYTQLFTVPVNGSGPEEALKIPNASKGAYSPEGSRIAYNPLFTAFGEWKHYRGGTVSTISIFRLSDNSVEKVPQPQSRCNDSDPMWIDDAIYFRSDRNGEFNIFSYDLKSRAIKQLTQHEDFPIVNASSGGGQIVYEQAGYIHTLNPKNAKSVRVPIGVATDLIEIRPRFARGFRFIRDISLSPTAARAALEFRGEIVTVPAEKGDPRNITGTPGANERAPKWSPDGKSIAYFSDESGEYALHVANQDGKGEARKFKLNGSGYYDEPVWSPDSEKIAFADNSWSLYWIDLKTGAIKKIGSNYQLGPARGQIVYRTFSPDSKWIVYTLDSKTYFQTVYAYSLEQDKSFPITDGLSDVSQPVFDASGKYLYLFGSTDAGPVKQWFDMSNEDLRITRSLYIVVLRKNLPSPIAKESDEEKGIPKDAKPKDEKPKEENAKEEKPKDSKPDAAESFSIDFDGIQNRILALQIPAGEYSNLDAGSTGQFYFLKNTATSGDGGQGNPGSGELHRYDLTKKKDDVILSGLSGYEISADRKKILYSSRDSFFIQPLSDKIMPGQGKISVDAVEVHIDPRVEWNQIFNEAWRINRDYFYASNMHGVDWNSMRQKYSVFLPDLAVRNDLNRVIQWMCSELRVGHHRVGGGDFLYQPKSVPGGLLGADYAIENGRYRFKKVYGGLNWNPELRSPLTEPGVDVKAGEYLLAVQGKDLVPPENLYSRFENTAGKIIEITVGPNPDGSGSRAVSVVPIGSESALRNRDWVEGNLKKVDEATNGRVAYVYVPNTSTLGHIYFKRYFYPQAYKDAIIVDERFNGGGSIADYYIDNLRKPFIAYWNTRYGADIKSPSASIQGPKVMLIDETAGSGGDLLPWMFRKFKMGKLIGKRTWGGLVGTLGFPSLMDGGFVSAPNLAIWTPEESWTVENEGVPPDIEVEQTPADVIAGHDPQLEKAIQVVMEELKKNPPQQPKRPPYPVKAGVK
jgi:tricorn protease